MSKKSGFRFFEVASSSVAVAAVVWLANSVFKDIQPTSTKEQTSLRQNAWHLDQLLKSDPAQDPITAGVLKKYIDQYGIAISPPPNLPQIQTKPEQQQDSILRPKVQEAKMEALEKRIDNLEKDQISVWTLAKTALIWLLTTFFTPVIGHLGKLTFGIESKD